MTPKIIETSESKPANLHARRQELRATREIQETLDNWTIYAKVNLDDPTFVELCQSIQESGINTPIEISSDNFVISGHRRLAAARICGLLWVPCLVNDAVVMAELSAAERTKLLAEHNRGVRIKTNSELYLEAAARVDPEEAVKKAQARKARVLDNIKKSSLDEVEVSGSISRTDPSGERAEMLNAVLEILEELRENDYLPTSGRSIHYKLLARNVRTSTRANGYIYGTRPGSAALLSKLLTDARSEGLIDHDDLDDGTRPSMCYAPSGTVGKYIDKTLDGVFTQYLSNIHIDQPNHVELLVEKNTIFPLLKRHVAADVRVPITSLRGYGSFPAARDVADRFKRSGKDQLIVIYVSDLDPEGMDMPASWKKYLLHDFGIEASVFRAAVTPEQVERHDLPPDAEVKLSSSRASRFIEEHGEQCWELDSMPEAVLIDEVSRAVKSVLDLRALSRALAKEQAVDVDLARLGACVRAFVNDQIRTGGIKLEGGV